MRLGSSLSIKRAARTLTIRFLRLVFKMRFTGGGSQVGISTNTNNQFELTNNTSFTHGVHSLKVGGRLRYVKISDNAPQNFGGTYTFFGGGVGPQLDANDHVIPNTLIPVTSIERYRRTLVFQSQGLSLADIRLFGGGASQFSLASGSPRSSVSQWDFGGLVRTIGRCARI